MNFDNDFVPTIDSPASQWRDPGDMFGSSSSFLPSLSPVSLATVEVPCKQRTSVVLVRLLTKLARKLDDAIEDPQIDRDYFFSTTLRTYDLEQIHSYLAPKANMSDCARLDRIDQLLSRFVDVGHVNESFMAGPSLFTLLFQNLIKNTFWSVLMQSIIVIASTMLLLRYRQMTSLSSLIITTLMLGFVQHMFQFPFFISSSHSCHIHHDEHVTWSQWLQAALPKSWRSSASASSTQSHANQANAGVILIEYLSMLFAILPKHFGQAFNDYSNALSFANWIPGIVIFVILLISIFYFVLRPVFMTLLYESIGYSSCSGSNCTYSNAIKNGNSKKPIRSIESKKSTPTQKAKNREPKIRSRIEKIPTKKNPQKSTQRRNSNVSNVSSSSWAESIINSLDFGSRSSCSSSSSLSPSIKRGHATNKNKK